MNARINGLAGRLAKSARLVLSRYRMSKVERELRRRIHVPGPQAPGDAPVVLIEAVEDYYYLALFAQIVATMAADGPMAAHQFVPRSLRPGSTRSPIDALKSFCFYNPLTDRKWLRLYSAFCCRVGYKSASSWISRKSAADALGAWRIWRGLKSKESLLDLSIAGIKVGDLIYDTYLRFKPAPTVDLGSPYLWIVIWQTLRDVRAARAYMHRARPRMFLTTYSTYIQHGVAVRVAFSEGIKVFSFGNFQEFYKPLHPEDWVHTRNPDGYRSGFSRLRDAPTRLIEADKALAARLSGKSDAATAYMQRSAYARSADLPGGLSGSLVLFLHDFFDSPHCYRWIVFPDFWEWATFTLDLTRRAGIKVFVKPHPNETDSSKLVVRELKAAYPEATWLSTDTSNVQLAEAGIACAVTVYGSVAHEMAYLGIPSIAAGHHPHIAFSISHTAHDREEYARLILNYRNLAMPPERMRRESLEFYCMHNLDATAEELSLRELIVRFRMRVINSGNEVPERGDFERFASELGSAPAFRNACRELAAHLHEVKGTGSSAVEPAGSLVAAGSVEARSRCRA